jgi:glycosyltransferase involved in cell wall biosynthesis
MHVGLNAHLLSSEKSYRGAGINWYIHSLLTHLPGAADHHTFTAFLSDREAADAFPGVETKVSVLPTATAPVRILWEQVVQPGQLLIEGIDLLHSLAFVQPIVLPCPGIVTIYDLSFFLFPHGLQPWRRLYLRWGTAYSARRARRVVVISASTKRDVVRLLGVPEDRIDVVPCGVDEDFRPVGNPKSLDALRKKRHLPPRMILFVGTIEPRKNLATLLQSYALLRRRIKPPPLVIAGAKGWRHEEVLSLAGQLDLLDDVIFPGYVAREELPLWYGAADLLVYPSLYEGFGLPPLEAMACGTAVVVSNSSSLPEVVGEAGLLVEPTSAEEMSRAMERVLTDKNLREVMRVKGVERAHSFTWQRTAEETIRVYDRAAAQIPA